MTMTPIILVVAGAMAAPFELSALARTATAAATPIAMTAVVKLALRPFTTVCFVPMIGTLCLRLVSCIRHVVDSF
jgi:hypothetical protein